MAFEFNVTPRLPHPQDVSTETHLREEVNGCRDDQERVTFLFELALCELIQNRQLKEVIAADAKV
jgi:hypothetical protein